jgi:hypothetical protein
MPKDYMTFGRRVAVRRIARQNLMWFAICLIAGQLALAVAVEGPWAPIRDPEYGHKLGLIRLQAATAHGRPLLVAIGSSLTLNGLRPDMLPNGTGSAAVFNFGLTRHGPVLQMLAFDRMLRDGVRPQCVTIELTPSHLMLGAHELDAVPAGRQTLGDVRFLYRHGFRSATYAADWLEDRATSSYTSRFALMSKLWPNWMAWAARQDYVWTHIDSAGWLACPPPRTVVEADALREKVTAGDGEKLRHFALAPDSVEALCLTLGRCRSNGISAAVILMPEAGWYRELLPADGNRLVEALAANLGSEFAVPVIDARAWCRDEDFLDGLHLLAAGAAQYTERFGREVVPLLTEPTNPTAKRR